MDIKVYTTPTCGYCQQAKRFLSERGVNFTEYDVSRDRVAAEEMVSKTGQMGVPVIVFGDQVVIGFDRARLEKLISGNGSGKRARFGLKVADAGRLAQKFGVAPVLGAVVGEVAPGSTGEKAGLSVGDIITEVNTTRISNARDLESALSALKGDSRVTIVYLRNQRTMKSVITL